MDDKLPRPGRVQKGLGVLAHAGTMGLHLVSGPAVGFAIGYALDDWLGTDPWLKAVFFFFGIISGFKLVYEDARKIMDGEAKERDTKSDPQA